MRKETQKVFGYGFKVSSCSVWIAKSEKAIVMSWRLVLTSTRKNVKHLPDVVQSKLGLIGKVSVNSFLPKCVLWQHCILSMCTKSLARCEPQPPCSCTGQTGLDNRWIFWFFSSGVIKRSKCKRKLELLRIH